MSLFPYQLSPATPTDHIKPDGCYQNQSFHDVLSEVLIVFKRHPVIEAGHKQRAQTRALNRPSPAHQTRSPDYARRYRVKLKQTPCVRRGAPHASRVDDAGKTGERAHYREGRERVKADVYA